MMVATRRMAAKQHALPVAGKPRLPAPRTPKKRARSEARGLSASAARSPPARRAVAQLLRGEATSAAPTGGVKPEKLDARVSLKKGMRQLEEELYAEGFSCVVGVDEAGRGPLVSHNMPLSCRVS